MNQHHSSATGGVGADVKRWPETSQSLEFKCPWWDGSVHVDGILFSTWTCSSIRFSLGPVIVDPLIHFTDWTWEHAVARSPTASGRRSSAAGEDHLASAHRCARDVARWRAGKTRWFTCKSAKQKILTKRKTIDVKLNDSLVFFL